MYIAARATSLINARVWEIWGWLTIALEELADRAQPLLQALDIALSDADPALWTSTWITHLAFNCLLTDHNKVSADDLYRYCAMRKQTPVISRVHGLPYVQGSQDVASHECVVNPTRLCLANKPVICKTWSGSSCLVFNDINDLVRFEYSKLQSLSIFLLSLCPSQANACQKDNTAKTQFIEDVSNRTTMKKELEEEEDKEEEEEEEKEQDLHTNQLSKVCTSCDVRIANLNHP